MTRRRLSLALMTFTAGSLLLAGCGGDNKPAMDEAKQAGRGPETLGGADEDYFRDMDNGVTKNPEALAAALGPFVKDIEPDEAVRRVARGRNNWNVWTAGNDPLWDDLSRATFGSLDFLKTLSNHPSQKYSRDNRWQYLGLVNEPCFEKGEGPRKDRYGLWLDVRSEGCEPDPFENKEKYPGVEIGARGKNMDAGSYYGYATGVLGARLFPNPAFDEAAEAHWGDGSRFYTDPEFYQDKNLVRPYRVGMSCGFCHIGPNPTNPPADPENPKWENLNSNPGAQYFWIDRIFFWQADESNLVYQLVHTSRPGSLDTSLVSSDNINNPRTMNAIFSLAARLGIAKKWGQETLADGGLKNAQFNDYPAVKDGPLGEFYKAPDTVWTPHVLKDGADSVGALGALNRVFVNIGLFSEQWLRNFIPLVGGPNVKPFEIEVARKNSSFWVANEKQTPDTALFFIASAKPDLLKDAPGGEDYLSHDVKILKRGKEVFADRCARCHSSKLPEKAFEMIPNGCIGPNYLKCWNEYWAWTKTPEFKAEMAEIVLADDFLEDNFLSTELRVPVTLLETNACSPLATNGLEGNIWDNFTSRSYKDLPSVGDILVHHPITGEPTKGPMPAGGRGYTRPASLIGLWSTAPYLLNNTVGDFYWTGSVEDRMKAFEDGIQKMLWPEKRKGDRTYKTVSGMEVPGVIDKTTKMSYLRVSTGYLPGALQPLVDLGNQWLPWFFGEGGLEIGPIPEGTPVNLFGNIDTSNPVALLPVLRDAKRDLKKLPPNPTNEQARAVFKDLVEPLLKVSKCRDFVVNRGHYFGTQYFQQANDEPGLSDNDKWALIEFLKTM